MHAEVDRPDSGAVQVVLTVSAEELMVLSNCINETTEAVESWEFDTRVGVPKAVAEQLHAELRAVIRELPP